MKITFKKHGHFLLCILLIGLVGANWLPLSGSLLRNLGMNKYIAALVSNKIDIKQLDVAKSYLNSSNQILSTPINEARLASIYTWEETLATAKKHAARALLSGGYTSTCSYIAHDYLRFSTAPVGFLPNSVLNFDHPQARWSFYKNLDANGSLSVHLTPDGSCEAIIEAHFAAAPNRYISTWQQIHVERNTKYKLSAIVENHGIDNVWVGIASIWSGTNISPGEKYRVEYDFLTGADANTETIQFLLASGDGTLTISDVQLEKFS